jgi:hypothetical protein
MGWGGRRPGAGAKKKPRNTLEVGAFPQAEIKLPPSEPFDPPKSLTPDERAIWEQQAPFAFASGTLVKATGLSFERYCRIVVMERKEAESTARGGSNHRGLLSQINAYELQFLLTPCGKPMPPAANEAPAAVPLSKLSRFRKVG